MRKARERADRVLDKTSEPVRSVYDEQTGGVLRTLIRSFPGRANREVHQSDVVRVASNLMGQLTQAGARIGGALTALTQTTLTEGVRSTAMLLESVRQSKTPLSDLAVANRIIQLRKAQIEQMRSRTAIESTEAWSRHVVARLQAAPIKQRKVSEVITELGHDMDQQWWRVERLVRTETSFAYNRAQADGVNYLAVDPEFSGKLFQRWTELINDLTGKPYDDKVAADSMVLHGQVAPPGGVFTMPDKGKAPAKMVGKQWYHPPNRPNDRAVLTPWMPGWGIPAWRYGVGRV
jgi:hypothetical protein